MQTASDIIDIGCGPGNRTRDLKERCPEAWVVGLDNSSEMIEEAWRNDPEGEWRVGDALDWETAERFDMVFSNAVLQWLSNHEGMLDRWMQMVASGGVLADQIRFNSDSPAEVTRKRAAESDEWREMLGRAERNHSYQDSGKYYEILSGLSESVVLGETTYFRVISAQREIIEWERSTGMRPYLAVLPDDESRERFEEGVLKGVCSSYPIRGDGRVLFPFKRLFFIASRAGLGLFWGRN